MQGDPTTGSDLLIFDRSGKVTDTLLSGDLYGNPVFSPDESKLALDISDLSSPMPQIWVFDLAKKTKTKLTFGESRSFQPVWSLDGNSIYYSTDSSGSWTVFKKQANGFGSQEPIFNNNNEIYTEGFTPDGSQLMVEQTVPDDKKWAIWTLDLTKSGSELQNVLNVPYDVGWDAMSPDGKWLAYVSNESDAEDIFITAYPTISGRWMASNHQGNRPRWRADSKELFYLDHSDQIVSVPLSTARGTMVVGEPKILFKIDGFRPGWIYDVSKDGQKIVASVDSRQSSIHDIVLVQNWTAGLKK